MDYTTTEKIIEPGTITDRLNFSHWPAFAGWIRTNHMVTYAQALLDLSREADLPIMKLIAHLPEEQLLDMTIQGHGEFLENVEKNILREHLNKGLKKWEDDDLGIISPDDIAMEDITIGTFIRKKAMLRLIPLYSSDVNEVVEIIKEIDIFDAEAITVSTALYIRLQKKKEEKILGELQQSRELYKQAQAISNIGNWSWDLRTDEIIWSDEMFRIYGLEHEQTDGPLKRKDFLYLRHPDDIEHIEKHLKALKETCESQEYYFRTSPINGQIKILHAHAQVELDAEGKAVTLYGTIQDVTEKMLIEQHLRENEAFITKVADTAPSIIATYNINTGQYNFVSEGITKLLGYLPAEVLEKGIAFFMDLLHPDDLEAIMEKNKNSVDAANLAQNSPIIEEFKYRVKDSKGKYRWLHTYGTVFDRNSEGNVEHVLNVSVDITDQVEAEHHLQEKNIELQVSNSSLQDYAYIASHDLKEPLRKISTFSSLLLNNYKEGLPKEAQGYLVKTANAAMRMQAMINDLLTVSTITGNKAYETYSLKTAADEALQSLEHIIEDKKATINIGPLPEAKIVPAQFRQLFQNLVNNSLKFSREGVKPEINITSHFLKPVEVREHKIAKANKYLQIEFTDNGIGFDNTYAEKIFSIFQRLHGQSEYEGTGIGLSICRKVVENHGGIIFASGTAGKGAKFTIIIPA